MIEHRLTERLIHYWNQLRAEDAMPPIGKLNPERIMDLWPNCMTVQVINMHSPSRSYAYEYVGNALQKIYGGDMAGKVDSSVLKSLPGWQMLKKIDGVLVSPSVIQEAGQFIGANNKIIKFRACILPFGVGDKVTHVVVGMSYKEF